MNESRRKFIRTSACGLTSAAMIASLDKFNLINAMTQDQQQPDVASDYRALVCIFLSGGTDGNNMVIPYDGYTVTGGGSTNGYDNVRTVSGLAVPLSALANTKITPSNTSSVAYAFHPNLSPEANNAGQAKGFMDVGMPANSQCFAMSVRWCSRSLARNTRRGSDARINFFHTPTRLISKCRRSPTLPVKPAGAVESPIRRTRSTARSRCR